MIVAMIEYFQTINFTMANHCGIVFRFVKYVNHKYGLSFNQKIEADFMCPIGCLASSERTGSFLGHRTYAKSSIWQLFVKFSTIG